MNVSSQQPTTLTALFPFMTPYEYSHVFVGSRAIGCAGRHSDWDFAFLQSNREQIVEAVEQEIAFGTAKNFQTSEKTAALKFNYEVPAHLSPLLAGHVSLVTKPTLTTNFIFLTQEDLKAWGMATSCMKLMGDHGFLTSSSSEKQKRVKLFRDLVRSFGGNALDLGGSSFGH